MKHSAVWVALGLGFAWTSVALAGDRHRGEVEIEGVSAKLTEFDDGWRLRATYDVETEHYPRSRFDLVLRLTRYGEVMVDATGRVMDYVVALDFPTEIDDEELEYEGKINEFVDLPAACDTDDMRLEALVMDRLTNRVVDSRSARVSAHPMRYRATQVQVSAGTVSTGVVRTSYVRPVYVEPVYVERPRVSTRVVRTHYTRPVTKCVTRVVRPAPVRVRHVVRPAPIQVTHVRRGHMHRVPRRGFHTSVTVRR